MYKIFIVDEQHQSLQSSIESYSMNADSRATKLTVKRTPKRIPTDGASRIYIALFVLLYGLTSVSTITAI
jgi:hypothetical protein